MARTEKEIVIDAPIEAVFRVITDYESYPEFLPELRQVTLLQRRDGVATARFEFDVIIRSGYTLRLTEDAPGSVTWTLMQSQHLQRNEVFWALRRVGETCTHARYGLEVETLGMIPKSVSDRLLGPTLGRTLERFKQRAEQNAARQ